MLTNDNEAEDDIAFDGSLIMFQMRFGQVLKKKFI
jgi:hypothetical protein